jgi:uncharacterized protein
LLDPVILFFVLGVAARLAKSDLRLPEALYEALSIYLLLAIGLKGGMQLALQPFATLWPMALAAIALSALIPLFLYPVLRSAVRLNRPDAASIAAHYGSVSVVTFAVAQSLLARTGIDPEPQAAMLVALMEAPGIVVGAMLARRGLSFASTRGAGASGASGVSATVLPARAAAGTATESAAVRPAGTPGAQRWGQLAHEVLLGKAVVLLLGGLAIGWIAGPVALEPIEPLFVDLFKGVLALFLLEMGLVAGGRFGDLRRAGLRLIAFGLVAPPVLGLVGATVGWALGLSVASIAVLATLSASASYIAAPTAMRIAVPQANPSLSIGVALGVTFPFNMLIGIPLYIALARWMAG